MTQKTLRAEPRREFPRSNRRLTDMTAMEKYHEFFLRPAQHTPRQVDNQPASPERLRRQIFS